MELIEPTFSWFIGWIFSNLWRCWNGKSVRRSRWEVLSGERSKRRLAKVGGAGVCRVRRNVSRKIAVGHRYSCRLGSFGTYTRGYVWRNTWKNSAQKTILHDFYPKPAGVNPDCQGRSSDSFPPQRLPSGIASGKECAEPPFRGWNSQQQVLSPIFTAFPF